MLLESLLINIINNAIEACFYNGEITLSMKTTAEKTRLQIKDNGCGMKKAELEKLGEPFYRVDKARSRHNGGAGLGVALCYQIASLHEATLHYSSVPQKGTLVTLEFTTL